jgi:type IV secretion system protein VirB6
VIESCAAERYDSIAALMATIDCHVAAYVARAYQGLFGENGWLTSALVGGLTIYVAIYGYRLIMGGGATVPDLMRRFIAMGFVIAFSSNWPAYQTAFVNTIVGGAEEVAGLMSVATTGRAATSASVAENLDSVVSAMTGLATHWGQRTPLGAQTVQTFSEDAEGASTPPSAQPAPAQPTPAGLSAPTMLWISALLLGVASAGVIVVTKITLGFLLALGPAFILFALFPGTRGLFEGWLRSILGGAFVLVFALLASAGALAVLAPMTEDIARNQMLGDNSAGPVFALAVASIVFAMLIRQVIASTTRLVSAWRLPERIAARRSDDASAAANPREQASLADSRIVEMVASVSRSATDGGGPSRASTISAAATPAQVETDASGNGPDIRRASRAYRGFGSTGPRIARGRA